MNKENKIAPSFPDIPLTVITENPEYSISGSFLTYFFEEGGYVSKCLLKTMDCKIKMVLSTPYRKKDELKVGIFPHTYRDSIDSFLAHLMIVFKLNDEVHIEMIIVFDKENHTIIEIYEIVINKSIEEAYLHNHSNSKRLLMNGAEVSQIYTEDNYIKSICSSKEFHYFIYNFMQINN